MIAALLALTQVAAPALVPVAPAPASSATIAPMPPQDWSTLPILPVRRPAIETPDVSAFVQTEVVAGRCARAVRTGVGGGWSLKVDLALLVMPDGRIRRITPRAIACPTVEQYAAGLLLGNARDTIDTGGATTGTWYRMTMTFAWSG